ncbi:MAG: CNP1-like family protein [Hydrogenophaga sp.]|uniref:CNP1-like family protein n=1 Tax=Hydrogenophaga sp. TaxID=1904254 RepID=UPI002733457B|nr:CNP1-like family protein [Hydrogenophaga sp.]MDP3203960.1 CNP1-like family protein [Hydrogenophaga sp.]
MIALFRRLPRSVTSVLTFSLLGSAPLLATAQTSYSDEKVWTEAVAAPPTTFSTEVLIPFEVMKASALTYGIDPNTLTVGEDGVVRYVMVARSSGGALNVLYQGIRCATAETKTYGRLSDKGTWNASPDADWQALSFRGPTRPAMILARQGICEGRTITGNARKILAALKSDRVDIR